VIAVAATSSGQPVERVLLFGRLTGAPLARRPRGPRGGRYAASVRALAA
jgi:hypothetical protein